MQVPIFLFLNETLDEVEAKLRAETRKLNTDHETISFILFSHKTSNTVASMQAALYDLHHHDYAKALVLLGYAWERVVKAPTGKIPLRSIT